MSHNIEFVYFDLGNVLLAFDPNIACRNLAERFDIVVDQPWAAVYESGAQDRFEHGELSGEEFAEQIRQAVSLNADQMPTPEILDAVSDMFTPINSMAAVLNAVQSRGLGVGLLSNTCHAHWDWICRQPFYLNEFRFDVTILSFEIGSMKPDQKIYHAAEQKSGVSAGSLLFLDDKQENVDAAVARKWNAVRCHGGPEASLALQDYQVLESSF